MAILKDGTAGTAQRIEVGGAARVTNFAPGAGYSISGITGTIAAAAGANGCFFAMRLDPATTLIAKIARIIIQYQTIIAYTTPLTAARRLSLFRGGSAALSGGTAYTGMSKKDTGKAASQFDSAEGGDARFSTTGALTVGSATFDTNPIRTANLAHVGAAGAFLEQVWEFNDDLSVPLTLRPGELIGIRNPAAMDAAGTWQLGVSVDWTELAELV